jgi:hypothetical protein
MTALTLTPTTPAGTDTDFSAGLTPALIGSIRRECLDHMIVFDALGPHGPGHPRDLVGKRDGGALRLGRRANNAVSQGRCLVPWILA